MWGMTLLTKTLNFGPVAASNPGHSGYPNFSSRVIRLIQNSSIRKCYLIWGPKYHFPQIRVPIISGSGIPNILEVLQSTSCRRTFSPPRATRIGGWWGRHRSTRDRWGREVAEWERGRRAARGGLSAWRRRGWGSKGGEDVGGLGEVRRGAWLAIPRLHLRTSPHTPTVVAGSR